MASIAQNDDPYADDCSTFEAARALGLAVRSVQLMVDRGELIAWKTPGGHRRISRASLQEWINRRHQLVPSEAAAGPRQADGHRPTLASQREPQAFRVLLIEDSAHYQHLVSLLVRKALPDAELHVADDGIAGLALAGKLEPQLLIVDILLPGIDGAALITSLRTHPQFQASSLLVVTSLDGQARQPYDFALQGVPVIHKTRLVVELPAQLERWSAQATRLRMTAAR